MAAGRIEKSEQVQPAPPLIGPGYTYDAIAAKISGIVLTKAAPRSWIWGLFLGLVLLLILFYAVGYLFATGVGIWGINIPVGWGFAIISLVWWIGIGHAGTLISAILLLFRQEWRTSINRFAEAMTLFAVTCAGLFPLLHLGRAWLAYWLAPYPNTFELWPQFRSPLVWDAFAIGTYLTVSALFWFIGLIPDLAALRDRAEHPLARYFYGLLALGWRGSAGHWQRYQTAYLLLAALATPLVVSVHSVVSLDFAVSIIPGWHTTIFPPYFVAGAIFSGFAMVLTLLIPLRKIYKLEDFITMRHLDNMAKVMLATGLLVAYGYMTEAFMAWYSGNPFEGFWLLNRSFGPYGLMFWTLILFNVLIPQALWSGWVRSRPVLLFIIALIINIGMWLERYIIIVVSLHRDFLPSSWDLYAGTIWDWATLAGTIGLFLTLIFLFIRLLPMISISEMLHLLAETKSAPMPDMDAKPDPTRQDHASAPTAPLYALQGRTGVSYEREFGVESSQPPSPQPSPKGRGGFASPPLGRIEGGRTAPLYGLMAEFDDPAMLLEQARRTYQAGYRRFSAYSPFPIEGLSEAIGLGRTKLPFLVLLGGLGGALAGFSLQYYAAVIDYPWNIGGRPFNSWPSFLIVTFELSILGAAGVAALGMLLLNRLPGLYHPVFNTPRFKLASQDRFFLCIKATDPNFDATQTRQFLESLQPAEVVAVEK